MENKYKLIREFLELDEKHKRKKQELAKARISRALVSYYRNKPPKNGKN